MCCKLDHKLCRRAVRGYYTALKLLHQNKVQGYFVSIIQVLLYGCGTNTSGVRTQYYPVLWVVHQFRVKIIYWVLHVKLGHYYCEHRFTSWNERIADLLLVCLSFRYILNSCMNHCFQVSWFWLSYFSLLNSSGNSKSCIDHRSRTQFNSQKLQNSCGCMI